uniref:Uncharacterized protein n=1 Tax=Nelumbo nucifera TaxID=4432 RepID=A0A822Y4P2_NELNU|nr:TPA_asm: hypothetical protein HUJ06_030372 [Nelumbo nucifera]
MMRRIKRGKRPIGQVNPHHSQINLGDMSRVGGVNLLCTEGVQKENKDRFFRGEEEKEWQSVVSGH